MYSRIQPRDSADQQRAQKKAVGSSAIEDSKFAIVQFDNCGGKVISFCTSYFVLHIVVQSQQRGQYTQNFLGSYPQFQGGRQFKQTLRQWQFKLSSPNIRDTNPSLYYLSAKLLLSGLALCDNNYLAAPTSTFAD